MLTLAQPWWQLLLPLPLLCWWLLAAHRETRAALAAPFVDRLSALNGQPLADGAVVLRAPWSDRLCFGLFWCMLVLGMARPQWIEPPVTRSVPVRDLLLGVDLSGSMSTTDFTSAAGQSVDRLAAVKEILDGFLERRKGDRVGLLVFGNAPFVQAPFTEDVDVCRQLLAETQVGMAGPKTAFGDALGLAIDVFDRSPLKHRVLIVLTDGNDTASQVPPPKAAEIARDKGIVIHTIAVGDPRAAGEQKLDEETLRSVATTTGGIYSHANSRDELASVYARLDQLESRRADTLTARPRRDVFYWPLAIGLLASLIPFGRLVLERRPAVAAPVAERRAA